MGIADVGIQTQQVRDELATDTTALTVFRTTSTNIKIVEHPRRATRLSIGESWIVGSSTNGIVGTNTNTVSGNQQVVGGSGRTALTVKVIAPNLRVFENFNYDTFKTATTADWDTGNERLIFAGNQTAQSLEVYKDDGTITKATMALTGENITALTLKLATTSNPWLTDDWQSVTENTEATLSTPGTELYWRLVSSANCTVTRVIINFE